MTVCGLFWKLHALSFSSFLFVYFFRTWLKLFGALTRDKKVDICSDCAATIVQLRLFAQKGKLRSEVGHRTLGRWHHSQWGGAYPADPEDSNWGGRAGMGVDVIKETWDILPESVIILSGPFLLRPRVEQMGEGSGFCRGDVATDIGLEVRLRSISFCNLFFALALCLLVYFLFFFLCRY